MSNDQDDIAIETRAAVKRYAGQTAVNQVHLQVKRGEFVSLLGPSGCGKTTLLRLLGGLEHPDEGLILLSGKDVTHIPAYGRNTNMIFQQLALFPHMDVYNNIAYGLKVQKTGAAEIKRRVGEILELVQLGSYSRRSISQLSGGQAQRVAIARALVNRPEVLLLDEPLSALDMQLRLDMQRELKRIQREFGGTFIFVTHDQHEAMNMSDRIGVMKAGRLLQYGTPSEIYERPADSFVAKFIGDTNLLPAQVKSRDHTNLLVESCGEKVVAGRSKLKLAAQAGVHGMLSIRYEYVRIGPAAEHCVNRWMGTVTDSTYGGANIQYSLEAGPQLKLQANVLYQPGDIRYQPGEQVQLGFNAEDVLFLEDALSGHGEEPG
ncbi:ABC transporter ATP-binding protein [Paenibacillus donghaensis]|uniref:Spermidine/putrescine import ATP-binding protein PotA n=1 Tax=Paenibacillus donghaensis TaxID=414771 RepID=A0A2Z2K885_9BACL|nr:ABC transporter ATP-binding protein [Paenibacillus donghaensis]ASA21464.1 polyamine ABC transporter ATP-binding protein [Paenibacillus donghaensis]